MNNANTTSFEFFALTANNLAASLTTAGLLTIDDDLVIKTGGTIGGASDTDLLTLAADALTVAGTLQLSNGSPNIFLHTTGNHFNWMIGAQENVSTALEISVDGAVGAGSDTNAGNYTPVITALANGSTIFAGTTESLNAQVTKQLTIVVPDISSGENCGLKLQNTNSGAKTWQLTPGLTGVNNTNFTIRNATDNANAVTITSGTSPITTLAGSLVIATGSTIGGANDTDLLTLSQDVLNVNGNVKIDGAGSLGILEIATSQALGSFNAGAAIGEVRFNQDTSSTYGAGVGAFAAENTVNGQDNHGAELRFFTAANGDNTTAPALRLKIAQDGTLTGTDTDGIGAFSDERLKENIADYTGGLALLKQLRPRTFEWKNTTKRPSQTGTRRGFIAQEINAVDTYWVAEINSKDSDDVEYNYTSDTEKTYTTKLQGKDAMYVSAIKELVAEIEALKERVETLEG